MTVSLLQVFGTAVRTEESNPVVIGVGQGIVQRQDMSCEIPTIFRANAPVSQGEYASPASLQLVSFSDFVGYSTGKRVFILCDTVESSGESIQETFFDILDANTFEEMRRNATKCIE